MNRAILLGFIDMLFNMLAIMFFLIHPKAQDEVTLAADYRLSIQWAGPETRSDDIDSYVLTPTKGMVFFRYKDVEGMVTLERDDLGSRNDISLFNREEVMFRSPESGQYFLSVHNYAQDEQPVGDHRVLFELVNQQGKIVFNGHVPMPIDRSESIIGSFVVKDGKIVGELGEGKLITRGVLR